MGPQHFWQQGLVFVQESNTWWSEVELRLWCWPWGAVADADKASLAHLVLTSCYAAQFLTSFGRVLHGRGWGGGAGGLGTPVLQHFWAKAWKASAYPPSLTCPGICALFHSGSLRYNFKGSCPGVAPVADSEYIKTLNICSVSVPWT